MKLYPISHYNLQWNVICKSTESLCYILETNIISQPYFKNLQKNNYLVQNVSSANKGKQVNSLVLCTQA